MDEHAVLLYELGVLGGAYLLVEVEDFVLQAVEIVDIEAEDDDHC